MPHQSRRYTESLVVRNTSSQPHKPEAFPGLGPLPVTAGHHTQTVSERQHYRSTGIGAVGPGRAAPRSPRAREDISPAAAPHRPGPQEAANQPPCSLGPARRQESPRAARRKEPSRGPPPRAVRQRPRREPQRAEKQRRAGNHRPADSAHPANRTHQAGNH